MRTMFAIVREHEGAWKYASFKNNRIYWDNDPEDGTLWATREEAEAVLEDYDSSRFSKHDIAVLEV